MIFEWHSATAAVKILSIAIAILSMAAISTGDGEMVAAEPSAELKRLRTDLLKSYDRFDRPVKNKSVATRVNAYFDVQHIVSLEEKYEILTVKGVLMMKWTDEHLTWSSGSYSGLTAVHFSNDEVWLPDIHSLYNVKAVDIYNQKIPEPVSVFSNGSVRWYPQVIFDVPCSAQYRHYPFDSHNCTVLLAAWTHSGDDLVLQKMESPTLQSRPVQGAEWLLTKIDHENKLVIFQEHYKLHQILLNMFLQRTSRIYRYVCVVPTLTSMISLLFGFWLLPNETSRYLVGCSNIVVLPMVLQYLAVTVPAGKVMPLLAQYSAACLCISAAFVVVTMIANLLRESSGAPPNGLVRLAHFSMDRYFCIFSFSHVSTEDSNFNTGGTVLTMSPDELKRRRDWYSVSILVDRIIFWCFVFIFVVLLSVLAAV